LDRIVLKILNGVQAGVEVSLSDGTYTLGSGADDDIHLIDVSLKPGHARLRVTGSKVEIAAAQGSLRTSTGLALASNGGWQALEPLDIVTAGTTRFALGPTTAQWATIVEDEGEPAKVRALPAAAARRGLLSRALRQIAMPVVAVLLLSTFAGWYVLASGGPRALRVDKVGTDLELTRAALDQFPFGRIIEARQEVDGAVFVSGYVQTPVERRALANAVEKTGVPARVRLSVLETIRTDVQNLIAAQKVDVTFDLSNEGRLTLNGLILNQAAADRFVRLVTEDVLGLAGVESHIRTANTLLSDVEKLATTLGLKPWLLMRVDNDLIEVGGALPVDKIDAWVGFLDSYARRFSKEIALRSLVQLQTASGRVVAAPGNAIVLGGHGSSGGDVMLDLEKLRGGSFKLGDVFVGSVEPQEHPSTLIKPSLWTSPDGDSTAPVLASVAPQASADAAASTGALAILAPNSAHAETTAPVGAAGSGGDKPGAGDAGGAAGGELAEKASQFLKQWQGQQSSSSSTIGPALTKAFEALKLGGKAAGSGDRNPRSVPAWYLPVMDAKSGRTDTAACWPDTQLDPDQLPAALFWLDLLSATDTLSLATFSKSEQMLLLEVALNPAGVDDCTKRSAVARKVADNSLYLREIHRNPGFVRFIVRDLAPFSLDVVGVNLASDRFVLTRAGLKMREGAAPGQSSRIALIGELGIVIEQKSQSSVVVFEPDLNWKIMHAAQ
jgi:type III secretion system YscD/HrpQ family protein